MDKTQKAIGLLRTTFTKVCDKIKDEFSKDRYDIISIQSSIRVLDEKFNQMSELNRCLIDLMLDLDESEENMAKEMDAMDNLSSRYYHIKCMFDTLVSQKESSRKSESKSKLKYPKLEFKQFGGDLKGWLGFWNQFSRIDEDSDLEEEDKLQYLVQATTPGSRARQLVESYPATKGNYLKAIESLKQRFGREDLLVEVYVRELLKLVLMNLNTKNKLSSFFDKIESQLRALESLGVTSDTCAAMLYPLVESCIGEDLIRAWQRSQLYSSQSNLKDRLDALMDFLRKEVVNEDRISLAVSSFKDKKKPEEKTPVNQLSTAADLFNKGVLRCVFCKGDHVSNQCKEALKLSLTERKQKLSDQALCHLCFKFGHIARRCRTKLRCSVCQGKHFSIMCYKQERKSSNNSETSANIPVNGETNLTNCTYTEVFLQTMVVELRGEEKSRKVRLLVDTGSHKSYITNKVAQEMNYIPIREEQLLHSLFGGTQTETVSHTCYKIRLGSLTEDFSCNFEALDQQLICNHVSSIKKGPWLDELKQIGIEITDLQDGPVDVLVGSDVAGKLFSGRKHDLECGLVAIHTLLGWTLMGKLKTDYTSETSSMLIMSLFSKDVAISNLWSLDVLGIQEPGKIKSAQETEEAVMKHFLNTVTQEEDKRYKVSMPWIEGHPPLPSNFELSRKRLLNITRKLNNDNFYAAYDEVFDGWMKEGIIELDDAPFEISTHTGHFLPHHPVYKPNSTTTPVRPVFDASSRVKNQPSLNQCLEKGTNLIELIPSMLLRFRTEKIGVIADIRKAFLQIGLEINDRNFVKFLWYDKDNNLKIFRHARVVFGITCSPFLLGAVLEYHLQDTLKKSLSKENAYCTDLIKKLLKSFYVDNTIASVRDEEALHQFIEQSTSILADGKFDLTGWEYSLLDGSEIGVKSNVLGLIWNRRLDTIELSLDWFDKMDTKLVSKRSILSAAHKLFDPIGFSSPVSLFPKLLLQKTWSMNLGWDTEIGGEVRNDFLKWLQDLPYLSAIKIPRWISTETTTSFSQTVHIFCDASADAYAACIFLRSDTGSEVHLRLIEAKSRVAPIKELTINRLELLAATIGVRMYQNFKTNYESDVQIYYWSDSSTVLSWIKREDHWKPFIWNRIKEIRQLSRTDNWYHVPGQLNPADLPSRGCFAKHLADGRWWEGPRWLYAPISQWPGQNFDVDEEEINLEKRKTVVSSLSTIKDNYYSRYYFYFSKFSKIVNLIGWIKRFINNSRKLNVHTEDFLTVEEREAARKLVIRLVQEECFESINDPKLTSLCPFIDDEGLIRLRTKISDRKDAKDFCLPYVLPSKHEVVKRLIFEEHEKHSHAGVQCLMSILRQDYWILKCRRTIKSEVSKCIQCKRFKSKSIETPSICLPEHRVRDAAVFEIVGIDLAGPLYLKSGEKVWIVLYTCAVYRAVHLELASSLSTNEFLQTLRRFIARRGRPSVIYSDGGTNFVGSKNAFEHLNWTDIAKDCAMNKIDWKINPPTAAWWGGWWERLIRILKDLLRKTLGRTCLNFEELQTILCDCEAILNARPLTYMSEDAVDCVTLTPSMFLQDVPQVGVLDIDLVEANDLKRHYRYRLKLKEDLNKRFKSEYLGQLTLFAKKSSSESISIGDIVLIMDFNKRKIDWPMGRVIEIIPGRDGIVRLVKLKTATGELLRPVQRVCFLEMGKTNNESPHFSMVMKAIRKPSVGPAVMKPSQLVEARKIVTRCGRQVKTPKRFGF